MCSLRNRGYVPDVGREVFNFEFHVDLKYSRDRALARIEPKPWAQPWFSASPRAGGPGWAHQIPHGSVDLGGACVETHTRDSTQLYLRMFLNLVLPWRGYINFNLYFDVKYSRDRRIWF